MDKIKHLPYLLFHPFDGFYEARHRGKGSGLLAVILLFIFGVMQIASVQYTGFVFIYVHIYGIQSVELFFSGVLPILLFIISNWSVAALMNGSGRFKDIFMVMCYAIVPLIIASLLHIIFSNILVFEELIILRSITVIGLIWFGLLVFSGLCMVHEYSAGRNIAALLATAVAAIIIVFLVVLYLMLMSTVISFVQVIFREITGRMFQF